MMPETKATLITKENTLVLRVKFSDGVVINLTQGNRLTTSSPSLLKDFKTQGPLAQAFRQLQKLNVNATKLKELYEIAPRAPTIIEFTSLAM